MRKNLDLLHFAVICRKIPELRRGRCGRQLIEWKIAELGLGFEPILCKK